jgi:enoyl-CoA hydratase
MSTMGAPSGSPLVQVHRPFGGCALVTLNRPEARNALSLALRRELTAAFRQFEDDADTRVVVLTGAGEAFCAGLDLKELGTAHDPASAIAPEAAEDPVLAMARFGGPIVGAVNGPAITGGFELALACDVLVASTRASFADTHARVGVLPGWGLSQRLPRLVGPGRAKELSLTGNFLSADRAAAWGLVNRVVEPERLVEEALGLAADMSTVLPDMLVAYKRLIDDGLCGSLTEGLRLEKERSAAWAATLDAADIERRRVEVVERGRGRQGPASAIR